MKKTWATMVMVMMAAAISSVAQEKPPAKTSAKGAAPAKSTGGTLNRALLIPAKLNEKAPETYKVQFATTRGDFVVQVTRAWAPLGADRFYNLVKNGFYDGASFFRVLDDFVVQFGISAYPEVSDAWRNARIKDDPVKQGNKRGTICFAKSNEANTRTTQVFISLKDNAQLDSLGFAAFGKVVEGMSTVVLFYGGYGEGAPSGRGPNQELVQSKGRAYLEKSFPKLDSIQTAKIVP